MSVMDGGRLTPAGEGVLFVAVCSVLFAFALAMVVGSLFALAVFA